MIEKIQIIHKDWERSFKTMTYESIGRVMMGLIAYAKDEDPSEFLGDDLQANTIYPAVEEHVQRNEDARLKGARNGSRGGAPVGNQNAKKTTENNPKQPKTTKNKQKQTPNLALPNLTINNKKTYGECNNVLLTDEEYEKVKEQNLLGLLEELSLYIASKGDKYKSHYAVIKQWANRREKEKVGTVTPNSGQTAKNQFNRFKQRDDYDFAELEAKLVRN